MFTGFYITDKGQQYIAKAMTGKTLVMTKGQYGDGVLPEGTVITSMTELVAPLADMQISKQNTLENCVTTTTQFSNRVDGKLLNPFYFMEAGLYAKVRNADGTDDEDSPETLICYTNAGSTSVADYIPGVLTEFILNWPLTISAAANVTVEISESLVYPTMQEFNARAPFKVTAGGTGDELTVSVDGLSLIDGSNLLITLPEDLGAFATISYNGGEAYPVYNSNGKDIVEGQQIAGTSMNVIYNEEKECWYIVGGGAFDDSKLAKKTEVIPRIAENLTTSILEKAMALPNGTVAFYQLSGDTYNGEDLPADDYKYGGALVAKRYGSPTVVLWGLAFGEFPLAINVYNSNTKAWGGWNTYTTEEYIKEYAMPLDGSKMSIIDPGTDLNTFYTGIGIGDKLVNAPDEQWYLIISGGKDNTRIQVAIELFTGAISHRYQAAGTWSEWNLKAGMKSLSTSVLEYATTLETGAYDFSLTGDSYTGGDLPADIYAYSSGTIFVRNSQSIAIMLDGVRDPDKTNVHPPAVIYCNEYGWSGWNVLSTVAQVNSVKNSAMLLDGSSRKLLTGTDLNNFYTGVGLGNQLVNSPDGTEGWFLIIAGGGAGTRVQEAFALFTGKQYHRYEASSVWSEWKLKSQYYHDPEEFGCSYATTLGDMWVNLPPSSVLSIDASKLTDASWNLPHTTAMITMEKPTDSIGRGRIMLYEKTGVDYRMGLDQTNMPTGVWKKVYNEINKPKPEDIGAGTLAGKVNANASAMATLTTAQLRDAVILDSDPGKGATVSYSIGTVVLAVKN